MLRDNFFDESFGSGDGIGTQDLLKALCSRTGVTSNEFASETSFSRCPVSGHSSSDWPLSRLFSQVHGSGLNERFFLIRFLLVVVNKLV